MPTCQGPCSLITSFPFLSSCTCASVSCCDCACRFRKLIATSNSAPTRIGKGYHFVGVSFQALTSFSGPWSVIQRGSQITYVRKRDARCRGSSWLAWPPRLYSFLRIWLVWRHRVLFRESCVFKQIGGLFLSRACFAANMNMFVDAGGQESQLCAEVIGG